VEGSNLKLMYNDHDPVLLENVGNIIIDMATGLEHVHESGFMHLDFKPENVLVTRNASVRLADFDLAKPIPEKPTKLAKNPGTPAYMSPEQLLREPVNQRADIFAFGAVLYEMLSGTRAFRRDTAVETMTAVLKEDPPELSDPVRSVSPALDRIVTVMEGKGIVTP